MARTPVLFVLHNHQPVGNLPWVTEDCYRTAYLPFLDVLERHPGIRMGLHFTGPLFEWLQTTRPDYLARVRRLVEAGQVEVLGGGFYEPILPVIPARDRLGQLALLRDGVTEVFGQVPTGAWLAERVWEPALPTVLRAAGVAYVLIDDEVFHRLGFTPQQTRATYQTEDEGVSLRLVPISRQLRYTFPTRPIDEVLATLRAMAADGAEVLVYAEDGERYGNWPGTYDYLYGEEAYLDRLFTALEQAPEFCFTLPGEFVRQTPPRGRAYLPPTSYAEMLEWSGGFWRNFLARYRESNLMQAKMYQVSRWVAQAEDAGHEVRDAQRDLYAAQCNCPYWYGAFGGLYLPHLRRAVYEHLLRAERRVAPLLSPEARPACEVVDHDSDGHAEVIIRSGALSMALAPWQGGGLFALEHLDVPHNCLATMARYPLRQTTDMSGLDAGVSVDWHPRFAFLDHFLSMDTTLEGMRDAHGEEQGDFVTGAYTIMAAAGAEVTLHRSGHCWDGPEFTPLEITKHFRVADDGIHVRYALLNPSPTVRTVRFAPEINLCLSAGDAPGRSLVVDAALAETSSLLESTRAVDAVRGACYRDTWLGVEMTLQWSQPTATWFYPVVTPMRSLGGVEWVYQSTVTLPIWEATLEPGVPWTVDISLQMTTRVVAPRDNHALVMAPG